MYIKSGPVQHNLIQNFNQPQKKLLAADITRRLGGLYFYKAPGNKYYFGLPLEDNREC